MNEYHQLLLFYLSLNGFKEACKLVFLNYLIMCFSRFLPKILLQIIILMIIFILLKFSHILGNFLFYCVFPLALCVTEKGRGQEGGGAKPKCVQIVHIID